MMLVVFQTTKRTKFQYGKGIHSKIGTVSQQPKLQRKCDEPVQSGRLFVRGRLSYDHHYLKLQRILFFGLVCSARVRRRLYSRA
jgi:hypothetical protein